VKSLAEGKCSFCGKKLVFICGGKSLDVYMWRYPGEMFKWTLWGSTLHQPFCSTERFSLSIHPLFFFTLLFYIVLFFSTDRHECTEYTLKGQTRERDHGLVGMMNIAQGPGARDSIEIFLKLLRLYTKICKFLEVHAKHRRITYVCPPFLQISWRRSIHITDFSTLQYVESRRQERLFRNNRFWRFLSIEHICG